MTQYIKQLPAVFQTVTEKKFFDATFDQVFSKKDSDYLSGYLGRRNPGSFDPISDFYFPEPSKDRTWWQLEATAFARNADSTKSNVFFYDDLLKNIEYYGGNTLNQDRLFNSEYYSFAPPIDYDMFINYQDYYWVEQGLPTISISGVLAADIVGQSSYTTPASAVPANFTLSTGMTVALLDDPEYQVPHTVENTGGCTGLMLARITSDFTAGTLFEFIPWDGIIEFSNGRVIDNRFWDMATWDTQPQPQTGDYITIQRGSINNNAWSRTNKWFHIDTIRAVIAQLGTSFPASSTRALRPIIQFDHDLVLYKSGSQFNSEIQYGFVNNQFDLPARLHDLHGQPVLDINALYDISLQPGDTVVFFNDDTEINISNFPWDTFNWDMAEWEPLLFSATINQYIFTVSVSNAGIISLTPTPNWLSPVAEGNIVLATEDAPFDGAQRGESWYYSNGAWARVFNEKVSVNQPPLFQLYDHRGVPLDDQVTYPASTFAGNKIFSYKVNPSANARADSVLKFPIVYTALGQASDIVFQNNLIVDRYTYGSNRNNIDGYYYFKGPQTDVFGNGWNLHEPCSCSNVDTAVQPYVCLTASKQRVIDKFVVGYGAEFQFKLSVTPYGYNPAAGAIQPAADIVVSVNGRQIKQADVQSSGYTFAVVNGSIYVDLTAYISALLSTSPGEPPVVEIQTYTHDLLSPDALGYSAIPQQLESNPNQLEVLEISGSELTEHFTSIISAQIGFRGIAFGGTNNYRDTGKNKSVGKFILQNTTPLLKTMLVSPKGDLSFIDGLRFSQDEYTKFKSKYLKVANQLINREFSPLQYENKTIVISQWVEEILKTVNISKEFSNAFAYSYMIANGAPFASETHTVPAAGTVLLSGYADLADSRNALYIYNTTGHEQLLTVGKDYEVVSSNLSIEVQFTSAVAAGSTVFVALYKNPVPAYIASTPSKLGTYPTYVPRVEFDTTYVNPTWVISGHDGSKTVAFGNYDPVTAQFDDYRDALLLELEVRIYNLIAFKYRNQYNLSLRIESVQEGFFNKTRSRYSRAEYLDITESYLNKWSAKNRANYRANDWDSLSQTTPSDKVWKLYNYSQARSTLGVPLSLPGNWKGIFQYMYDTYMPDTRPWEMLGISEKPAWWEYEYGAPVMNTFGQPVWTSTAAGNNDMWADLEAGIVRQGASAVYDPVTGIAQPQEIWARPGLSSRLPVDAAGEIVSVMTLFDIAFSGNPTEPFDGYDADWVYGDGAPVEQAWKSTSTYAFSVQEFLFLMRPAAYGEYMWDTAGTELSPGRIVVPGSTTVVNSGSNWQYVQNDKFQSTDPFFAWMRPKNSTQQVHAESVDGQIQVRYGYQRWISDRILFLGKDIADTFGQKVRTLDVNLANKLAGFTNKDTTNTFFESISPGSASNSLSIPSVNFDVMLHKSPVVDTYVYSGVVIRALADGTFVVYGYDLLSSEFRVIDRSTAKLIDVSVGGTPAEFMYYTAGTSYKEGDIVRYNGVYYVSLVPQTPTKFEISGWQKLKSLPTVGGVSVSYKPVSEATITKVPYGTIFKTPQAVFDFLIGWGAYLESRGWKFDEVSPDTNQISDWLASAKQFLFWLNSAWAPDAAIQLSPLANKATLIVDTGYPDDVETISNGVYSILDKSGIAIAPNNTVTDRDGRLISVEPTSLAAGGIYYLQVNVSETEHILIFDNKTSFNDTLYSPLLSSRQQRIRFNGFRTNGWYGKMEAPGYLVVNNQLVPNFDTIVDSMRHFYDPNVTIDNQSLEDLGRHLIGYESKSYLDNLQLSDDVQYLFYKGSIRQKGTRQAFDKLFRSTQIQSDESIEVYEEWALKLADFGNTVGQVSTEIVLRPEVNTGEVVIARLNYKPSSVGFVKQINILNAEHRYTTVPTLVIGVPTAGTTDDRQARGYIVLDSQGRIARVDITDAGNGYLEAPTVSIFSDESNEIDRLYAVWQGSIERDTTLNNIVEIDIDDTDLWISRPTDPVYSLTFPRTATDEFVMPNAGYVNFNDVDYSAFDVASTIVNWGTAELDPVADSTVWVAKNFINDWGVYKLVQFDQFFDVVADENNNLVLRTNAGSLLQPQSGASTLSGPTTTDFGNIISLQVVGKQATGTVNFAPATAQATAIPVISVLPAASTLPVVNGLVTGVVVTNPGSGYVVPPSVTIAPPVLVNAAASSTINSIGAVSSINVVSQGTGYASATVIVQPPVASVAAAASQLSGNQVFSISVTQAGSGYTSPPAVTVAPPVGETAVLLASISSGSVNAVSIFNSGAGYASNPAVSVSSPNVQASASASINTGALSTITVDVPGSGYVSAPVVTVTGDGTGATATAVISGNTVSTITITAPGTGYTFATISIAPPTGTTASVAAVVSGGTVIETVITNPGSGYASPPALVIAAPGTNTATATANIFNGRLLSVTITNPGQGYSSAPTVSIAPPVVAAATAAATIVNSRIVAVTLTSPGAGYYDTAPVVTITPANGVSATATASIAGGNISAITVTSGGSGYSSNPAVVIDSPPNGGAVSSVTIVSPGLYLSKPSVTVLGNGVGAELDALWNPVTRQVYSIDIVSAGTGYTTAEIVISAPEIAPSPANNGQVLSVELDGTSRGYNRVPQIEIYDSVVPTASLTVVNGAVAGAVLTNAGFGYLTSETPPVVTIHSGPAGTGSGAVITAVLGYSTTVDGIDLYEVTNLVITAGGSNYVSGSAYIQIAAAQSYPVTGSGAVGIAAISDGELVAVGITNPGQNYISPAMRIASPTDVNPAANYALGFEFSRADAGYNYYNLVTLDGTPVSSTDVGEYEDFGTLLLFKQLRFLEKPAALDYVSHGDKVWVDFGEGSQLSVFEPRWTVYQYSGISASYVPYRNQEKLIDTSLFQSASIFDPRTKNKLGLLPVYDPFKNILPAPAIQNITYTTHKDPAKYNVTPDVRLFSENIAFGDAQVGQLWWDLSSTRYVYYEQPRWLNSDGTYGEDATENLVYRRNNWGNLFPGSSVAVYEWVKSPVPPEFYAGTGTPKDITSYVQISLSNRFTNTTETSYYFWVLGTTDKPNRPNRTLAARDVSRILQSPKTQNFAFFAPIQETEINNSYIFYNVQETLAYKGDNIQIQYRLHERNDQEHTQWAFYREGESASVVTDQFWNKMTDSLCGYTKELPFSDEYSNSIIVVDDIPWAYDMSPWDTLQQGWDIDNGSVDSYYSEILPVPDPMLGEAEKYGIKYRPRQGMFVNLYSARKVFVQAANEVLRHIPIRDDNQLWNADVLTDQYWEYTTWYKPGYENAAPTVAYQTLAEASTALTAGNLRAGDIVRVFDGTADGRFVMYAVVQLSQSVSVLSLEEIGIEASAIRLLDTVYTSANQYSLAVELRQLISALRNEVLVKQNLVDQNTVFFSMINYVLSEQKNPDWVFKTSYIYIKENNIPLVQDQLYAPNRIADIIKYIKDVKPYHTQIRDYTTQYTLSDLAFGTASDSYRIKGMLQFGPQTMFYTPPAGHLVDSATLGWDFNQGIYQAAWDGISDSNPYLVNSAWDNMYYAPAGATEWAPGTVYSEGDYVVRLDTDNLYRRNAVAAAGNTWNPAEWDLVTSPPDAQWLNRPNQSILGAGTDFVPVFSMWPETSTASVEVDSSGQYYVDYSQFAALPNNPQSFAPPADIVAVYADGNYLIYGQDYLTQYSATDARYSMHFYEDPAGYTELKALVWFNGGQLQNITFNTANNETALGYPKDNLVTNIDTRLVVNDVSGIAGPAWAPATVAPLTGWGDIWESIADPVVSGIIASEGGINDIPWDAPVVLHTLEQHVISSRQVVNNSAQEFMRNSSARSGNLDVALNAPTEPTENIDVIVVSAASDIYPSPTHDNPGVIWIGGERIEYKHKQSQGGNVWHLKLARRASRGTSALSHAADSTVWVEAANQLPVNSGTTVWNAINSLPADADGENVSNVPMGGLWYAQTAQAQFLKQGMGSAVPPTTP